MCGDRDSLFLTHTKTSVRAQGEGPSLIYKTERKW